MSLTFKAFLYERTWRGDPVEIRRFTVDQDVSSSYTYLLEKVAQVFPSLRAQNVILAWTDSDGDIVTISSDEELVEALDQFEGNIFRLYLKKSPRQENQSGEKVPSDGDGEAQQPSGDPTSQGQSQGQGSIHPGVICDSCNGHIYGTRYKCLVCRDYDLCSLCEGKGVHVDHNMVSISTPWSYHPWGGFGRCPGGFGGPSRGRGGCRRGGRGRFGGPFGPFGPFGGPVGGHPFPPCGGQGFIPPWCQGFGAQGAANCSGTKPGAKPGAKPGDNPEKDKGEGEGQEPMDTEQKPPGPSEEERRTFLQGVGEAVSNFLEPFGVKVDVDVLGGAKPEGTKTTSDTASPEAEAGVSAEAVEEALAQLKSMGYQDEGGWLVELVKAKGGDVTQVLDALHPTVEETD